MHLRKWCEQCRDITTKWDAVTDALVNPKKQIDNFTIDSVISSIAARASSGWFSSPLPQTWSNGKYFSSVFFFFSPHGNTRTLIIKNLFLRGGQECLFLFFPCFVCYSVIYLSYFLHSVYFISWTARCPNVLFSLGPVPLLVCCIVGILLINKI